MQEFKNFIPTHCPACNFPLSIDTGKKDDIVKLVCTNKTCCGTILKKLQKGIIALEIRGIGPSTIEKLLNAGITSSYDLFNPEKFNEKLLIDSGFFQKGRALTKLITAVGNIKEISIEKAILSLQLENIGKTFSLKIGQKMSGIDADFTSLMLDIREQLDDFESDLNYTLKEAIAKFEEFGVIIKRFEVKEKNIVTKKISKTVYFSGFEDSEVEEYTQTIETDLSWGIDKDEYQMLIVPNKKLSNDEIEFAKTNSIKIMTWKQIKLLFL